MNCEVKHLTVSLSSLMNKCATTQPNLFFWGGGGSSMPVWNITQAGSVCVCARAMHFLAVSVMNPMRKPHTGKSSCRLHLYYLALCDVTLIGEYILHRLDQITRTWPCVSACPRITNHDNSTYAENKLLYEKQIIVRKKSDRFSKLSLKLFHISDQTG